MSRLQRALAIRDAILPWLATRGTLTTISGHLCVEGKIAGIEIILGPGPHHLDV